MNLKHPVFQAIDGELRVEQVSLAAIAERHGTPTYVYSRAAIVAAWREFADAVPDAGVRICYAMKANSNLAVLGCLAQAGASFDIVSGGELQRVLAAGGRAQDVFFSGVGKRSDEIALALEAGVHCFNVESHAELGRLDAIARAHGVRAPVSLRINPDVDAGTHPYISTGLRENKFGIAHEQALETYAAAASMAGLRIVGIDCHIGSQITELAPFLAALDRLLDLVDALEQRGIELEHIDLGGGLGISYRGEIPPSRASLVRAAHAHLKQRRDSRAARRKPLALVFEFGRSIVGQAGALLTRVEYLKPTPSKRFAILDCAMNDLIRPSLYDAYHEVVPVRPHDGDAHHWDLVGPVCESGDWLARDRRLALSEGDLLAILDAGAYGMAMSSNYNTRGRAAEVLVDGARVHLARERESFAHQIAGEHLLPQADT